MDSESWHKYLVYRGPPSRHLRSISAIARQMWEKNDRRLYLNSKPMIAGLRSYLAADGVDVEHAMPTGSLEDRDHLIDVILTKVSESADRS